MHTKMHKQGHTLHGTIYHMMLSWVLWQLLTSSGHQSVIQLSLSLTLTHTHGNISELTHSDYAGCGRERVNLSAALLSPQTAAAHSAPVCKETTLRLVTNTCSNITE